MFKFDRVDATGNNSALLIPVLLALFLSAKELVSCAFMGALQKQANNNGSS